MLDLTPSELLSALNTFCADTSLESRSASPVRWSRLWTLVQNLPTPAVQQILQVKLQLPQVVDWLILNLFCSQVVSIKVFLSEPAADVFRMGGESSVGVISCFPGGEVVADKFAFVILNC